MPQPTNENEGHKPMNKVRRFLVAVGSIALLAASAAQAQGAWPTKAVRIIVPAPPGTAPDIFARLYADQLSKSLGQPFVVDNRVGASGNIGADAAAKAAPDGYTLFYAFNQIFTMNPHLFGKLSYDGVKDLTPVAQTLTTAYVILGNNDLPATDLAGVLDYAKKNPGKLAYASYGPGTASHLLMELIQERSGTYMLHVPYKQGAVTDVIGGQVAMVVEPFASGLPMARSGKAKALAVTSPKRLPSLPEVPALNEVVKGLDLAGWNAFWVPAGTPADIVTRLNAEIVRITHLPEVKARIAELGSEATGTSGQEVAAMIQRESAQWKEIIRTRHIRLD
jgi:tripartite-type tricarboxylate transporter receptor subunit TctC